MVNSIDPDETAYFELSHLDLHCLRKYLYWSTVLKELNRLAFIQMWKSIFLSFYIVQTSRKHTYIILTPLNPTFI